MFLEEIIILTLIVIVLFSTWAAIYLTQKDVELLENKVEKLEKTITDVIDRINSDRESILRAIYTQERTINNKISPEDLRIKSTDLD